MQNRTRRLNLQTGRVQQPMGKSPSGMRMLRRGLRRWKMSKRIRSVSKSLHSFIHALLDTHAGYTIGVNIIAFGGPRRGAHHLVVFGASKGFAVV